MAGAVAFTRTTVSITAVNICSIQQPCSHIPILSIPDASIDTCSRIVHRRVDGIEDELQYVCLGNGSEVGQYSRRKLFFENQCVNLDVTGGPS